MKATIQHNNTILQVDLSNPIDISIPLTNTDENPIAWYIDKPVIEPVRFAEWIGSVDKGASTNFNNIFFNPHGHGTHTECLGHITRDFYSINQCLKEFFFMAELISIQPEVQGEDLVITMDSVLVALDVTMKIGVPKEALIIRTLPNLAEKKSLKYSNTNPPYLSEAAARFICESGIRHLLIDLPSVDRENDEGKLLAHKAFWNVKDVINLNADARLDCTITEMIFVADEVPDGSYLLNLQIVSFENDASPSKPLLYSALEDK
ncbi:cyclase family protein [Flavobacterium granuli]|uniref:Kynurenine formamidase n=1 Tax=Flavobacterium granuli TaxID=280093 RepID=A0A1M5TFY5_9FLAO|nr:cyclase family protein [Flavobacterium granuli]PRZ20359.1 kynurenine formamidase [Flavobacterium granuli]SHH49626.1 Kynurenine formamidase [Flavobacterium granuli]